ncbi:MAG: hypothetical protein WAW02_04910 [Sideroxyarcus sp.]
MAINVVTPKAPQQPALPAKIAPDFVLVQQQFPKVAEKIALMWGTLELHEFFTKTIFDERGGRQGFPLPIVSALMRLHEYHVTLIPVARTIDAWDNIA